MKQGVSATLLLACLTVAPVAFAQEPTPRTTTDVPAATSDPVSTSPDSATPADATAAGTASTPAPVTPDTPVVDTPPLTPATPKPVTGTTPTPMELASSYQIGPEDVLEISVWKNPELSRTVPVRPDGKVSLPLV